MEIFYGDNGWCIAAWLSFLAYHSGIRDRLWARIILTLTIAIFQVYIILVIFI